MAEAQHASAPNKAIEDMSEIALDSFYAPLRAIEKELDRLEYANSIR